MIPAACPQRRLTDVIIPAKGPNGALVAVETVRENPDQMVSPASNGAGVERFFAWIRCNPDADRSFCDCENPIEIHNATKMGQRYCRMTLEERRDEQVFLRHGIESLCQLRL
jgi:hypothetical protein